MEKAKLLGFNIDTFTLEDAVEFAKSTKGFVVTINPEMIEYALTNEEFKNIINSAELVIPDGIGVQIGLKISGYDVKRIAGVEFARRMLEEIPKVALIGAKPHVNQNACTNLKNEIPNLDIVYSQDGYYCDEARVFDEVVAKNPGLVLVALGSPKQEEFIYKLKSRLVDTLFIGVGGSFDVWAGEVKRAPIFYQKLGIEWLYRTIKEPKRFKRIFPTLPLFILKVLKEKWSLLC